jgi:hypothetical protein
MEPCLIFGIGFGIKTEVSVFSKNWNPDPGLSRATTRIGSGNFWKKNKNKNKKGFKLGANQRLTRS